MIERTTENIVNFYVQTNTIIHTIYIQQINAKSGKQRAK